MPTRAPSPCQTSRGKHPAPSLQLRPDCYQQQLPSSCLSHAPLSCTAAHRTSPRPSPSSTSSHRPPPLLHHHERRQCIEAHPAISRLNRLWRVVNGSSFRRQRQLHIRRQSFSSYGVSDPRIQTLLVVSQSSCNGLQRSQLQQTCLHTSSCCIPRGVTRAAPFKSASRTPFSRSFHSSLV